MILCHCGRPNCAGNTPDCHPLRVKPGETPRQALDREGAEKRAASPTDDWRREMPSMEENSNVYRFDGYRPVASAGFTKLCAVAYDPA